ncbi:MAG: leucyl aminopeptidase family protein [Phycisphaerales bacterium]|nr:leucyl aminopeptidase family protein [Phycisphaerales bacterium]
MFDSIKTATRGKPAALVVALYKDEALDANTKKQDIDGSILKATKRPECTGELGSAVEAFPEKGYDRVIVVGLGDRKSFTAGALRTAAAAAGKALARGKCESVLFDFCGALDKLTAKSKVTDFDAGAMVGEGLGMLSWSYDTLRGSKTTAAARPKLAIHSTSKQFTDGVERGLGMAEGANLTRTLSQTPPNIAVPNWMAEQAKKLARRTGMRCTVYSGKKLVDEKLTGHIEVGKASENKPCMIRLDYTPARGKSKAPIVLVGKTITYDTGGLSLKISNGMKGMKRDKDGGCGVMGAMHNIATVIKPNRPVTALLVSAENSVSDNAYRPDDVIEFLNGVTVEITNTDAEGRLVLADGLAWACKNLKPEYVLDMATLTGGVVVALGSVYAGMWCDDDALRAKVEAAAQAADEPVWRLPHHAKYNAMMKSPVADIVNSAPVREAHPIQGAAFLSHFVEEGTPWVHLDIAGTHATEKDLGYICPGPTGFGARLIAELVERS